MELSDAVKHKLAETVELWADDNLIGKPALLANCMFITLENAMKKQAQEIIDTFGEA